MDLLVMGAYMEKLALTTIFIAQATALVIMLLDLTSSVAVIVGDH